MEDKFKTLIRFSLDMRRNSYKAFNDKENNEEEFVEFNFDEKRFENGKEKNSNMER